jgi:plastocyanin
MNGKLLGAVAVVLLAAAFSLGCLGQNGNNGSGGGGGGGYDVAMQGIAYQPAELTVPAGTTVTWKNLDSVTHDVTSTDGNFTSSGNLNNGDTYQVTFDQPGTYSYHCVHHPGMNGTITVT